MTWILHQMIWSRKYVGITSLVERWAKHWFFLQLRAWIDGHNIDSLQKMIWIQHVHMIPVNYIYVLFGCYLDLYTTVFFLFYLNRHPETLFETFLWREGAGPTNPRRGVADAGRCILHFRLGGLNTLQGTNISYLGKRKIIDSKVPAFVGDILVPRRVHV